MGETDETASHCAALAILQEKDPAIRQKPSVTRVARALRLRSAFAFRTLLGGRSRARDAALRVAESKQLVFCITNGRSGSAVLAAHFECLEAVHAEHEAEPKFTWLLRQVQRNPGLAEDFLIYRKLPRVGEASTNIYAETSHLFGKGFFEPCVALGIYPDLVMLRRRPRDSAKSLFRLGWIPGRGRYGPLFFLSPDDAVMLELRRKNELSDYQLCFWHALETEARQAAYSDILRGYQGRGVAIGMERLDEPGYFENAMRDLDIPVTQADKIRLEAIRGTRFNEKRGDTVQSLDEMRLDEEEAEVREAIETRNEVHEVLSL